MSKFFSANSGVYISDSPEQLDIVKKFLDHRGSTRVRYYSHSKVEVKVIEHHGDYLLVSIGGMLGWVLKSQLIEIKDK